MALAIKKGTLVPRYKKCGSEHFWRNGKSDLGQQVYKCRRCGYRFVWRSDLPNRRFFSNVISFAVGLYATLGVSLRTLVREMLKFFGIKISHEGIRQLGSCWKARIVCQPES